MKILLASDVYPPYVSGVAIYTKDIASALVKKGVEVRILIPDFGISKLPLKENLILAPSIDFPLYPSLRMGFPGLKISSREIRKFNPDIVHIQTQGTIGLWSSRIAKKLNKPLLGTYHTYFLYENNFKELGISFVYPEFERWMWRYNRWFYNQFDGLISPSKNLIGYLKGKGIRAPIVHIRCPIDLKEIRRRGVNKRFLRKKFQLGEKNILYVGRISGEKNLDNLIKAFRIVKESSPGSKLILVGDGPSMPELRKLAQRLKLKDSVVFTGFIDRKALLGSGLFSAVDIFATASESENQPLSIIEAMTSGLPVVGVWALGIPELVTNNGLLSPPGDIQKLAWNLGILLRDKKLRKKLGKASEKNASRYDIKKVTEQLIDYYQSFIYSNVKTKCQLRHSCESRV